jgi:hypothetical protein
MELYRTLTGQSQKSHQSHQSEKSKQIHQTPSRASTKDPLVGHLNHLTVSQEAALESFKTALHTRNLWKPGTSATRPSHDDATLLYGKAFLPIDHADPFFFLQAVPPSPKVRRQWRNWPIFRYRTLAEGAEGGGIVREL